MMAAPEILSHGRRNPLAADGYWAKPSVSCSVLITVYLVFWRQFLAETLLRTVDEMPIA